MYKVSYEHEHYMSLGRKTIPYDEFEKYLSFTDAIRCDNYFSDRYNTIKQRLRMMGLNPYTDFVIRDFITRSDKKWCATIWYKPTYFPIFELRVGGSDN